jgi:hypothetical protein
MKKPGIHSLCRAVTSLLVASGGAWGAAPGAAHTVGGTISGLTGSGLVLRLDGRMVSAIVVNPPPGATRFVFPTGLAAGSVYTVTVQTQPAGPPQRCAVTRGQRGTIDTTDLRDVMVDCNIAADIQRPHSSGPEPQSWDVYVDAFEAQVEIIGLSYNNGDCNMSGGNVSSAFRLSPSSVGKKAGMISWDPATAGSVSFEFYIDSNATVGPQKGQQSANIPLTCEASTDNFTNSTYRMTGEISSLSVFAALTSPMPENGDTNGSIGCPPKTNTCHVQFGFDNAPGPSRTLLNLTQLLGTGSVTVPISGTATNVADYGETRSGTFSWSGSVKLRGVPTGP